MKRNRILLTAAVVATAGSLSACGMFHQRSDYYTKASESRPLEVPPDLDTPSTTNELSVPQSGGGAAAGAPGATASNVTGIGETELRVADTVQSTWQRAGAALDRAKVGTVSSRDENTHSYTLDFTGSVSTRPEGERHWYTPVLEHLGFGEDEKKEVTRHVTVNVTDQAGASRVSVTSDSTDKVGADATRRVVDVLRENLAVSAPAAASPPAAPVAAAPAPPPGAAPVESAPPALAGVTVAGSDLHVADTVQSTWQRVGLALERAAIGTLSARDENAHTYTLDFNATVDTKPAEHHWYTRILHPFGGGKSEQVHRSLTVRVADDAGGSRVSVEGDMSDKSTAEAARRVVEVLRERLS